MVQLYPIVPLVKPMCVDKSTYCIYGKKVGQCESENNLIRDYMKRNCKKSCGFCGGLFDKSLFIYIIKAVSGKN